MKYFKKIIGERIYLSPMSTEDIPQYTEWLNDLRTTINLGFANQVLSLEKEKEAFADLQKGRYNFAAVRLADNQLLGNCGLFDIDQINGTGTVGLFIGDPVNRSQGYGTEMLQLILDFGFNILNLHNIKLIVHAYNQAGVRCYFKAGFKEIGRRRECHTIAGKKYDEIYMDILSSEYESIYVKKVMGN